MGSGYGREDDKFCRLCKAGAGIGFFSRVFGREYVALDCGDTTIKPHLFETYLGRYQT